MTAFPIRVLVVDDYEPWRRYVLSALQKQPDLEVVGQAADGLEAVNKTEKLQPDLILLDIGLPTMNGIEAARRIREVSPRSKILFISENRSWELAERALLTGAGGYVVKSDAADELLSAIRTVLQGKQFVGARFNSQVSSTLMHVVAAGTRHRHEVAFYDDDLRLVDGYARFIESALEQEKAVIVVMSEAHRANVISRLKADGVDVTAAIERGRLVVLDASDTLASLTVHGMPDPVRCAKVIGDLIVEAAKSVNGETAKVAVCGEIAPTLLSKGNDEGAIELEHLWDQITKGYGVHTLCGYTWSAFLRKDSPTFEQICAEHSALYRQSSPSN